MEFRIRTSPRGFRDEDWSAPGPRRVLCLGDSCTFGRATSYPRELERIFDDELGPEAVDVLNAGVPGYTSFQARLLLDGPLRQDRFDLLVLYIGFNDARPSSVPDSARPRIPAFAGAFRSALSRLRLYQGLQRLRVAILSRGPEAKTATTRVPLPEFQANLRAILAEARTRGARSLLLTTPSLIPRESEEGRDLAMRNGAVLAVAAESGVPLVDLDRRFRETGLRGLFDGSEVPIPGTQVGADLIHPNELGLRLIAESVREAIGAHGLLPGVPPALREEPARNSFGLACGDVDGDGTDEIAACAERGRTLAVALLDARGRRRWLRRLEGTARTEGPLFLAAPRGGDVFYALDCDSQWTPGRSHERPEFVRPFSWEPCRITEFRDGKVQREERPLWAFVSGGISGFAALDVEGDDVEELLVASREGETCSIAVFSPSLEARSEFPLRVPPFAVGRGWRTWTLAPGPRSAGPARFVAAPDPSRPVPGWAGFGSFASDGTLVDGCMAFGFGGFEAGLRLSSSQAPPRVYAARGPCVRVFERVGNGRLPWLAVDAVFPFGFSSDPFRASGCAIAVLPTRGEARILVVAVEERQVVLELDAWGEIRRRIFWP
ncbi:MAG TPA: SGNH/GDSL hydrolase family protein [Planctomycetota bacterium]|nr:SGNH/GDSL hydrolase family protein [Planctomycetota bacterium]